MVPFIGLYRNISRLAKYTLQNHYRKHEKFCVNRSFIMTENQAVSDGELNMSAKSGGGGSSSSLPGSRGGEASQTNGVLSWAVSFEKLLEDPTAVRYFTAFLQSEVSAENILFWQACSQFQKMPTTRLKEVREAARAIYQTYLADSAPYPVNIDDTAKIEEKDLEQPTTDMFNKAQAQIFKLMKMDSYRRFVLSRLYQSCSLASVEGKPLPSPPSVPAPMGSWEDMGGSLFGDSKKDKKLESNSSLGGKNTREKRLQFRGSWGASDLSHSSVTDARKELQVSIKSTSSVEPGSLYRQLEESRLTPRSPEQGGVARLVVEGGYCCVFLPDGSASLAPTRAGVPLRDMLASLCEKRAFPLKDVIIYLHGKDKQPLSLDQDCSVLRDQQVSLELRVTFTLEVVFTGKPVKIMVKSSKTLQDALSVVLQKHQLKPQDVLVTMNGSHEPLNMNMSVYKLANQTLQLDKIKGGDQNNGSSTSSRTIALQGGADNPGGVETRSSQADKTTTSPNPSKNHDMDGFLDMLSRAQCYRVEDQRGLLTKEHLELPQFLQLPPQDQDQVPDPSHQPEAEGPRPAHTNGNSENRSSPAPKGAKGTSESFGSEFGALKETDL